MKDSRPASAKLTQPAKTLTSPPPSLSTSSVQKQPRSVATAEGVSTTKVRGGAQIKA